MTFLGIGNPLTSIRNMATNAVGSVANAAATSLQAQAADRIPSIIQTALKSGKDALFKGAISIIIHGFESTLDTLSDDQKSTLGPNFQNFLTHFNELKRLSSDPTTTQEALENQISSVIGAATQAQIFIEETCLGNLDQELIIPVTSSDVQADTSSDLVLEQKLSDRIDEFTKGSKRKRQLIAAFGNRIDDNLLQELGTKTDSEFNHLFNQKLKAACFTEKQFPIICYFKYKLARLWSTIIAKVCSVIFEKFVNPALKKLVKDFIEQDQDKSVEFINKMFVNGLELYANEIINIGLDLANPNQSKEGTPATAFEKHLSEKKSLRGNFETQKEFYRAFYKIAIDKIFSNWLMRSTINHLIIHLFPSDPIKPIKDSVRNKNGYQYGLDQALVNFAIPLIRELNAPEAASAPRNQSELRAWSEETKSKLQKALKSLPIAIDFIEAPNHRDLIPIASKKPPLLSTDNIFSSAAETIAKMTLEKLNSIMTKKFLYKRAIDCFEVLNQTLSANKFTIDQMQEMEQRRIDVLGALSSTVINKSIENIKILNPGINMRKMNESLDQLKALIERDDFSITLVEQTCKKIQGSAGYIDLNDDQKKIINQAALTMKEELRIADKSMNDKKATLRESSVFAHKFQASIRDNHLIKKVTKFVASVLIKSQFNNLYKFSCNPLTVKHLFAHQIIATAVSEMQD